jgi:hypothetical protein
MEGKLKNVEIVTKALFHLGYGEKHSKTWKMKNTHYRTWVMGRKLKSWQMRSTHCRTWNMSRKTEKTCKMRNKHCRIWIIARKVKNLENETKTLYNMEYVKKQRKT